MDSLQLKFKKRVENEGNNEWLAFRLNSGLLEALKSYKTQNKLEGLSTAVRELLFKQLFQEEAK